MSPSSVGVFVLERDPFVAAAREREKLIRSKLAKGYAEVALVDE